MTTTEKTSQERINAWKTRLEELELQLNLGKKDALNAFEEQKQELRKKLQQTRDRLEGESGENLKKARARLDELIVQLNLAKAESREEFEKQSKKLQQLSAEVREDVLEILDDADVDVEDLQEELNELRGKLDKWLLEFRAKTDAYRVQLYLGKAEAKEAYERNKKILEKKINEARQKLEQTTGNIRSWDDFTGELKKAFADYGDA